MATIGEALAAGAARLQAAGSSSPRLDAELLLGHAVGLDRTGVVAHPQAPVGPAQAERYESYLARRETGEPVAYIREVKAFHGVALSTDPRALIPRPETELLVDLGVARTRAAISSRPRGADEPPFRVIDVGTGCGAIAIAMARSLRKAGYGEVVRFTATDISEAAIGLAVENAVAQGVADLIDFRVADLLSPSVEVDGRPDLLVANLPYVASDEIDRLGPAIAFEPRVALDGGPDGLAVISRCLDQLPDALAGGPALLEIGADQVEAVLTLAGEAAPGWLATIHADLAGLPRVLELERPRSA